MSTGSSTVRVEGGRALERTALAWNRSALALAATGGLIGKAGADEGSLAAGLAAAGALIGLAVVGGLYGLVAYRRARAGGDPPLSPWLANAALATISASAGVAALVIILAG